MSLFKQTALTDKAEGCGCFCFNIKDNLREFYGVLISVSNLAKKIELYFHLHYRIFFDKCLHL